jgi:uncharacterized membrane protein YgdD (TMEM256/DUF423 family)
MNNSVIKTAAFIGMLAVILGAFGAHTLKTLLTPEQLDVFKTAVLYQFFHVMALLVVGLLQWRADNNLLKWAAYLFVVGIILFSGSLYVITACHVMQVNFPKILGPITPIGGVSFIAGWLLLMLGAGKGSA